MRDRLIDVLRRRAGDDLPLRLVLWDGTAFDFGSGTPWTRTHQHVAQAAVPLTGVLEWEDL